jgi:hypothetical protein
VIYNSLFSPSGRVVVLDVPSIVASVTGGALDLVVTLDAGIGFVACFLGALVAEASFACLLL